MYKERIISGRDNPRIKYIRSLHKRKTSVQEGVIFVEGARLCEDALNSGFNPRMIVYVKNKKSLVSSWCERFSVFEKTEFLQLTTDLFERVSSTVSPQGVAAVFDAPAMSGRIPFHINARYMVCEHISDPGNLGNILRTAEAFSFDALVLIGHVVDPFNEKVLRASMGACFRMPIVRFDTVEEAMSEMRKMNIFILGAHLNGEDISEVKVTFPAAIFLGSEAHGLSDLCISQCDILIRIPMSGRAESLNVASAAAILAYVLTSDV